MSYDLEAVRQDFPILSTAWNGQPLVYLDSAASAQKPRAVSKALVDCYEGYYSNIERGVYGLAQRATAGREQAREAARRFLNARDAAEIAFVRGTTEALNLVAACWAVPNLRPGDEVLVTEMEHHSNFVPWQQACLRTGATLRVLPIDDAGELRLDLLDEFLTPATRLVAVTHVSNVLGTVNPIAEIAARARNFGALVAVDGAQAAPHLPLDVQALGCDFYAFSGHKVYGPSGIGVLWGRSELLAALPPWQSGGGMVRTVAAEETTFAPPPQRFEAGTPFIEGAIGLGAALDYLSALGLEAVAAWEHQLLGHALEALRGVPGLRILGPAGAPRDRAAVVSFVLEGIHPHDVGTLLDRDGIAVRVGHLCAQPLMAHFGVPAVTRASFGLYNTLEEADALAASLRSVREFFG